MGGKGPCTRSIKNFRSRQTSCRPPDASRENCQGFRVAPQEISCASRAIVTSSAPMHCFARAQNRARILVATVLFAAFSWTLLVSVSPQLHARIHADAHRADHVCAITLIASGSYEHGAQPPLVIVSLPAVQFSKIPALTSCWVQSPFLGARIFEHAPPARG